MGQDESNTAPCLAVHVLLEGAGRVGDAKGLRHLVAGGLPDGGPLVGRGTPAPASPLPSARHPGPQVQGLLRASTSARHALVRAVGADGADTGRYRPFWEPGQEIDGFLKGPERSPI